MKCRHIYVGVLIALSIQLAVGLEPGAITQSGEIKPVQYHQFVITDVSPVDFYPAEIQTINITMQNIYNYSAYGVSTVIDQNESQPIKITHELQNYVGSEIHGNQNFTTQYELYIPDTVPKGTYYIPIGVLWTTVPDGIVLSQENLYIGIKVIENPDIIKIETENITTIPEHITPGNPFKMKVTLKNTGNSVLNQIRAFLDVQLPFSSIGANTEQYISELEPNQSADVFYNLLVDKETPSRVYNFNFTLQYKDYANRQQLQEGSFGVNVEDAPDVYIQDVTLDPTTLNPSTEGLLDVKVANAGTNDVKNVRVTIFGGENILTQSQNFIGVIHPGGASTSATTSFGILVDPNMQKKDYGEYGLNIQINYDDASDQHHSISSLYILKVTEQVSQFIPLSPQVEDDIINDILYTFIFTVMSYGIFLLVGYQLDKKK